MIHKEYHPRIQGGMMCDTKLLKERHNSQSMREDDGRLKLSEVRKSQKGDQGFRGDKLQAKRSKVNQWLSTLHNLD